MKNIVILGATTKADRFAFKAMQRLKECGYKAIPVNPAFHEILGEHCHPTLSDVPQPIDTVTIYLGAARSAPLTDAIIGAKPRRIIFNPGAENPALAGAAQAAGIETVHDCTLVMLDAGRF